MRWTVSTEQGKLQKQIDAYCHWHTWFAWYPVRIPIDENTDKKVWMEKVGRKMEIYTRATDMYCEEDSVGYPSYCFYEEVVIKALQEPEIIDRRRL